MTLRPAMPGVVLVTGASSGIGRAVAILLARKGFTVYAGAPDVERTEELADHGITALEMDVTKGDDNEGVVGRIIRNEGRIDVLVNNAGFGLYGPVEDIPLADARYQFEVNLFGLAHVTRLVLPHMRAQGSGRIINTSSMMGRVYTPLGAWYGATKHALEGWSDCLRLETAPFNIQVVLIQPGAIKTEFVDVSETWLRKYPTDTAYAAEIERYFKVMDVLRPMERGTEPEALAKVFLKAATARTPRRRYVKGLPARPMMFLRKWFGDGVYEFLLRRGFH